eukprot:8814011-Pyramimonas_sp.AAC.1
MHEGEQEEDALRSAHATCYCVTGSRAVVFARVTRSKATTALTRPTWCLQAVVVMPNDASYTGTGTRSGLRRRLEVVSGPLCSLARCGAREDVMAVAN